MLSAVVRPNDRHGSWLVEYHAYVCFMSCHVFTGEYGPYAPWVPEGVEKLPTLKKPFPTEGSVYDWVYDAPSGVWREWMETAPKQVISPDAEYSQVGMPVTHTHRH